ncbi:CPXCG motif-containing cysteine-rich protein [Polaribacter sp.]|jgi:transcription elongation factor Elf1|nr:CPXCG motif-containing cysteine-rich protein [Polaribacter sp.]
MLEHFFQCPYCWDEISMLLDMSVSHQNYVEDCETCCNPIQIDTQFDQGTLTAFNAINLEQ